MGVSRLWLSPLAALLIAACAARPAVQPAAPASASRTADADALPDGPGRTILNTHCTWCHDLGEVTKFRGYYDRAQWRDIVTTMVDYGARVEKNEVEVLSDYLVQQLGRKAGGP